MDGTLHSTVNVPHSDVGTSGSAGADTPMTHVPLSVDDLSPDNAVSLFHSHYRRLAGVGLPHWDDFDICAVPRSAVAHVALARPEYLDDATARPDHFVYTLVGDAVRPLMGRSMAGLRVGSLIVGPSARTLLGVLDIAIDERRPVLSYTEVEFPNRPKMRFTRGVFMFAGTERPIERLVLVFNKTLMNHEIG